MEKKKRGFANLSPEKRREIASRGGKKAQEMGVSHKWTSETAKLAGQKGGSIAQAKGAGHRFSTEEAKIAGQKGGSTRWSKER